MTDSATGDHTHRIYNVTPNSSGGADGLCDDPNCELAALRAELSKLIDVTQDQHDRVVRFQTAVGHDILPHNPKCLVEIQLAEARRALAEKPTGGTG